MTIRPNFLLALAQAIRHAAPFVRTRWRRWKPYVDTSGLRPLQQSVALTTCGTKRPRINHVPSRSDAACLCTVDCTVLQRRASLKTPQRKSAGFVSGSFWCRDTGVPDGSTVSDAAASCAVDAMVHWMH